MVVHAIAPRPAATDVERGEGFTAQQFRRLCAGGAIEQGEGGHGAKEDQRLGIMGSEQPAGQRDIGDVAARGMNARVVDPGPAGQSKTVRR